MRIVRLTSPGLSLSTLLMAIGMGLGQLATAVAYLIAARSSSPPLLGRVLSATAIAVTIGTVLDWGSTSNGLRNLTQARITPTAYGSWTVGRGIWFFTAGILLVVFELAVGTSLVLAVGCGLLLATVSLPNSTTAPWRAAGKFLAVAANTAASRLCSLAAMALAATVHPEAAPFLPLALSLGFAVEATAPLFGWPSTMRRPQRIDWWPWRGSGRLGLANVALSVQTLDIPVIARSAGTTSAGEYGAVSRWTAPLGLIATSFCQSAFPRLAGAPTVREALAVMRYGLRWLLPLVALASLAAIAAPTIVDYVLGPAYRGSGAALATLAVASVFGGINQGLYTLLVARRRDTEALASMALLASLQLTAASLLSRTMGAQGGALAVLLAQTATGLLMTAIVWRMVAHERTVRSVA